jgi:hypothetical protein
MAGKIILEKIVNQFCWKVKIPIFATPYRENVSFGSKEWIILLSSVG